jgi:hypothetical protein
MNPDLFWIPGPWPGRLAIVTRPRGGDWLDDEASGWRRAGVDVVVSLLESAEAAQLDLLNEPRAAEANSIRFVSFPIQIEESQLPSQGPLHSSPILQPPSKKERTLQCIAVKGSVAQV